MSSSAALGLVSEPFRDLFRERELVERAAEPGLELRLQRGPVELRRVVGLHLVRGAALDELALDRVQGRELVVARGERAELRLDAEQVGEKIVQMRRDLEDQRRFGLAVEARGILARSGEVRQQRARAGLVGGPEVVPEGRVELDQPVAAVELGEGEAEGKL